MVTVLWDVMHVFYHAATLCIYQTT